MVGPSAALGLWRGESPQGAVMVGLDSPGVSDRTRVLLPGGEQSTEHAYDQVHTHTHTHTHTHKHTHTHTHTYTQTLYISAGARGQGYSRGKLKGCLSVENQCSATLQRLCSLDRLYR